MSNDPRSTTELRELLLEYIDTPYKQTDIHSVIDELVARANQRDALKAAASLVYQNPTNPTALARLRHVLTSDLDATSAPGETE